MRLIRPDSYPATVNNLVDTCRVSLYVYPFGEWHQCLRIFGLSSQHRASCHHHINSQNVFFHSIRYYVYRRCKNTKGNQKGCLSFVSNAFTFVQFFCQKRLISPFTSLFRCFFRIIVFQHIYFLYAHFSIGRYSDGKRNIQVRLRITHTGGVNDSLRCSLVIYDSFEYGF